MMSEWNGPLEKIDDFRWRVPQSYRHEMNADGVLFASEKLMKEIRNDQALEQLANVATLPGIVGASMSMPDTHWGYGFPIGGVAAFDVEEGIISPGGVGYDINCGVRLMRSDLRQEDVLPRIDRLTDELFRLVPSGMGSKSAVVKVSDSELEEVVTKGAQWAAQRGFATREDVQHIEEHGCIEGADPEKITPRARERGCPQIATLGAGNHFLEVQAVEEIFNPRIAQTLGILEVGQVTVMVHTGSRGFGYQVCDDSLEIMQRAAGKYGIKLVDRQLACAPVRSAEAQAYLGAMRCAVNYAFANRQVITYALRQAFERVFSQGWEKLGLHLVYDVAHNIAKFEEHEVDGKKRQLCVHRKGATRAFPPGSPFIPEDYKEIGQPVLVPGDMGTCSYLLVGTETAMRETWGSTCHGAGRVMSRNQALKGIRGDDLVQQLLEQGITVKAESKRTVAEEAPFAYKDVSEVVDTCDGAGISKKVAKLRPLGVIKG
ncbi:MAG: RtcB family protein [Armatimonadetes bacterium]|nr:RtcB family protein [Armatimonadota bacterium]